MDDRRMMRARGWRYNECVCFNTNKNNEIADCNLITINEKHS
jgi:hypothetical protein